MRQITGNAAVEAQSDHQSALQSFDRKHIVFCYVDKQVGLITTYNHYYLCSTDIRVLSLNEFIEGKKITKLNNPFNYTLKNPEWKKLGDTKEQT